jgi:integrase
MASIRERTQRDGSRVFHVQVRMNGFPSRTSSFPSRRLAERWAKTIEAEMIEGKHFRNVEARRRTLREAIDRYMSEIVPQKRDGSMSRTNLPYWREKIGNLKLADVSPAVLVEHRDRLARGSYKRATPGSRRSEVKGDARQFSRSPSTVNRYLTALSHVFTIARKEWHWVSHNPFDGVSKMKEARGRIRYLTEDERGRLLAETAKDPTLHALVVIALSTAARAGELLKLEWADVDLKEKRLLFRITKNFQPRAAWLHGEAFRLLSEHASAGDRSGRVFANLRGGKYEYAKPFRAACAAANLVDFKFHDLRHSAATYLAREGASEQQLRAIGGWKSGVVSRYVHIAADDARDILKRMNERILPRPRRRQEYGGRCA